MKVFRIQSVSNYYERLLFDMFNNNFANSYPENDTRAMKYCNKKAESTEFNTNKYKTNPESAPDVKQTTYGIEGYPLASMNAPIQQFTDLYDCETALSRGTVFSELDLPFVCGRVNGGDIRG